METQQQQEQQPANAVMSHGTTTSLQQPALGEFTAYEIEMAELLAGLSRSNTSTGEDDASEASITLGSSSPLLVNPQPPARELVLPRNPGVAEDGDEEEHKQDVPGRKRKPKQFRSITEIYYATDRFVRHNLKIKKE